MKSITFETETTTAKLGISDTDGILINGVPLGGGSASNTTFDPTTTYNLTGEDTQSAIEQMYFLYQGKINALATKLANFKSWRYVNTSVNRTATVGEYIRILTGCTVTLPASASDGDRIGIMDPNGLADTETFIVDGNGNTIYGNATVALNIKYFAEVFQFVDTIGWILENTPVTNN